MSGLAVVFHRDGRSVDVADVSAMLAAVPHRGLDGTWVRDFGEVGLGYAKLALTPEDEGEVQPVVSRRTGCAIVADVRLDNREELIARLGDPLPPDVGDAELILRCYERWGVDAPARLLGDFAYAIWDPRHRRLSCARDIRTQKPLYYRADGRSFVAASEIHQLFQDPSVPMAPNMERVRLQLIPFYGLRNEKSLPETYYEGIYAVPAGHSLVVEQGRLDIRPYWELQPPTEIRYRSDDEYAEHFLAVFSEAVRARLRSSRPVGALLSGGLDSSSVVCVAQELYRAGRATDLGFTSISTTYPGLECDETHLIEDIRVKYGFPARYVPRDHHDPGALDLTPRGFRETPLVSPGRLDPLGRAAHEAGIRTLLTGDVADSVVRGWPFVLDSLLRQGKLQTFLDSLRAYRGETGARLRKVLVMQCLVPMLPLWLQKPINLRYMERVLGGREDLFLPGWVQEPLRGELGRRHAELTFESERTRRFANPGRALEYASLWPPESMRPLVNWPTDIWRPYNDRRVIEFLLAIPPEQKYDPRRLVESNYAASKQILRRALRGILPESIRARTHQTHFGSTALEEIRQRWADYEHAFGPSARPRVAERGLVDRESFWQRLVALRDDGDYGSDFIFVSQMLALESWLQGLEQPWPQRASVPAPWGTSLNNRTQPPSTPAANEREVALAEI